MQEPVAQPEPKEDSEGTETKTADVKFEKIELPKPNRHERRREAALARKAARGRR